MLPWFNGILTAAISGAASAASIAIVDPDHFNISSGLSNLGKAAAAGAVIGAINHLRQSPFPGFRSETNSSQGEKP